MARALAALVALSLSACGGGTQLPSHTLPLPAAEPERNAALDDLGRRAFDVLANGKPERLLLDDQALRELLEPEAAGQAAALRGTFGMAARTDPDAQAVMRRTRYAGVCVQRARLEGPGPALGLRESAFVVDRLLVAGVEPGGGRVAAWVEGTFLYTDQGFFAVVLQRLETPRRDHADLDLAQCDFRLGLQSPRGVVVSGADSY